MEELADITGSERIIGHYRGREAGPLLVVIGGIHGNEPAGVRALERLFEMLRQEPLLNPGFTFRGELLALRGNLGALAVGERYLDEDLNRIWRPMLGKTTEFQSAEEEELHELLAAIESAVEEAPLSELVLLDLHTTSSGGGIFAITGDDRPSLRLAAEMGVPVVKGMLESTQGTTLHYFRGGHFATSLPVRAVVFEAGQHADPVAVDLALAATVNLLRALGCVRNEDVSSYHDELLREGAGRLPRMTELSYVHHISRDGSDGFRMRPGYGNFQAVVEGERVADDRRGPVAVPASGYLLMPLYQQRGNEGFFLVRDFQLPTGF